MSSKESPLKDQLIYFNTPSFSDWFEKMNEQKYGQDVFYCVAALVDLQGFSSHLELGGDLRTKIGNEAINRLNTLDSAVSYYKKEFADLPHLYPKEYVNAQRINDSIVFTMDLPVFFLPSINEATFEGHSAMDLEIITPEIKNDKNSTSDELVKKYYKIADSAVKEISQFIGFISRIHRFIAEEKRKSGTPGCKTIICSGYRKSYKDLEGKEDHLSANFAFSNSYNAEKSLHGPNFFIDSNILKLLSLTKFTHNIIKIASIQRLTGKFDPFSEVDYKERRTGSTKTVKSRPITVNLFRREYQFYPLDESKLAYLQIADKLSPLIPKLNKSSKELGRLFGRLLSPLKRKINIDSVLNNEIHPPGISDISSSINDDLETYKKSIED